MINTIREFRNNMAKAFDAADEGAEVYIRRGKKDYRIERVVIDKGSYSARLKEAHKLIDLQMKDDLLKYGCGCSNKGKKLCPTHMRA